jgi:hypothetical protein
MNERIKELAEQAGFQSIVRGDHIVFDISTKENLKEFAELLIKECAKKANAIALDIKFDSELDARKYVGDSILKSFGVEQ